MDQENKPSIKNSECCTKSKIPILLGSIILLVIGLVLGYMLGSKPQTPIFAPPLPPPTPTEAVACTQDAKECPDGSFVGRDPKNNCEFVACPASPTKTSQQTDTYSLPKNWRKYTDKESGITIFYPTTYTPKYNPNRGVGINYSAGSYLLDNKSQKILDFYKLPYKEGSRREAFYDVMEFDGPSDMSKYTVSATDISLNGKTYLKLISNYWKENDKGNRVFFLASEGNQMYYFTYPASLENEATTYKNILTIVANHSITTSLPISTDTTSFACTDQKSNWNAHIDSKGNFIIVQETTMELNTTSDKSKIEVWGNPQDQQNVSIFPISDFEVVVDPSQKGNQQSAFVITIKKSEVDRIIQKTPSAIQSISVMVKINGGIETITGKPCHWSSNSGYYTQKP